MLDEKLKEALNRGADISRIAKLVEVSGLSDLVAQLAKITAAQQEAHTNQTEQLIKAIDRLVDTVSKMDVSVENHIDITEAVESLRQDAVVFPDPVEWEILFERDQRNLMKSGIRLKPVPRMLN